MAAKPTTSRQSEVRHLHGVVLTHQDISGCQVAVLFEVGHACGDLRHHVYQRRQLQYLTGTLAQVRKQRAVSHQLRDNVDGLTCAHREQLHQLGVIEILRDLGFLQEIILRHGSLLESLHRHVRGAVPVA